MNHPPPNSTSWVVNLDTRGHGFLRRMKDLFTRNSIPIMAPGTLIPIQGANSRTTFTRAPPRGFSPSNKISTSTLAAAVVSQQLVMAPLGEDLKVLPVGKVNPKSRPSANGNWDAHTETELKRIERDGAKAWAVLKTTLGKFNELPGMFPPLRSAARALMDCLDIVQMVARNRSDYVELANNLSMISESLLGHLQAAKSTRVSDCITNFTRGVHYEIEGIQKQLNSSTFRESIEVQIREEDLIKRYRRIEALFRRLEIDIDLSGWNLFDEYVMNNRLARLSPAQLACYNSQLSEQLDRRGCAENTCTAVNLRIRQWSRDSSASKICWVTGMPGTGKTTIAYSFSESLEKQKTLGATFFCTRRSTDCHDAARIFPTIAYQLASYSTSFQHALCEVLSQSPDIIWQKISTQFERLIKDPLITVKGGLPENVVVIIDGLDECIDKRGVMQILGSLFQHAEALPLKFFVTSRPEADIYHKLSSQGQERCSITDLRIIGQSTVQDDIKAYLQKELQPLSLTQDEIDQLVLKSGRLFLYAATIVRYIQPGNPLIDHQARLKGVLAVKSKSGAMYAEIDTLYTAVVRAAMEEGGLDTDERGALKLILWTVLCAQQAIDIETIRILSGLAKRDQVTRALRSLASVLNLSQEGELVSTLHTSFIEFMSDPERSKSYCCNEHHEWLTQRCFDLMREQLRFNICDLESPHVADNHKTIGLKDRIDEHVSPSLSYACRYWGNHLELSAHSRSLHSSLDDFLTNRLLFWIEVLNLKRFLDEGEEVLFKAVVWLKSGDQSSLDALNFAEDARNFVTSFAANKVSISTPHLYISALPFCHKSSSVFRNYSKRMRGILEARGSLMEWRRAAPLASHNYRWETKASPSSFAFSSDGTLLAIGYKQDRPKRNRQSLEEQEPDKDYLIRIRSLRNADIYGPFRGHSGQVASLAFSQDGKYLASGSEDRSVLVWDIRKATPIGGPYGGHTAQVNSVAFSPDGSQIASGSNDGTIHIRQVHSFGSSDVIILSPPAEELRPSVQSISYSPDSAYIASGGKDSSIRVWDLVKRAPLVTSGQFQGHNDSVNSVAFSPSGEMIISGSNDCTIRTWRLRNGTPIYTIGGPKSSVSNEYAHTDPVSSVRLSLDGKFIVSGSWDSTIRIWATPTGELVTGPFEGPCQITAVSFSVDGTRVLSASQDCAVQTWSAFCGVRSDNKSRVTNYSIDSVEFAPDGWELATGCSDNKIRLWREQDGELIFSLEGHEGSVRSVSFSPDTLYLVSGSDDCTIRVWDVRPQVGKLLIGPLTGHTDRVGAVAFSPNGANVASGSNDYTVRVWSTATGELVTGPLRVEGSEEAILSLAYTSDGTFIISASINSVFRVWDAASGHQTGTVSCREEISRDSLAPRLPRRNFAATGLLRHKIAQNTGHAISALELTAVTFSHDASYVAFGCSDGTIQAWYIRNHRAPEQLFKSQDASPTCSLKFSHDAMVLASASWDRTVRVRDARTGSLIAGPFQHKEDISSVSLSPDAKSVASGCENSTLLVWDLRSSKHENSSILPEQWIVCDDGWVSNQQSQCLFWMPQDIARYHPTRHTKLIIGSHGSVYIDFRKLLQGYDWRQSCLLT